MHDSQFQRWCWTYPKMECERLSIYASIFNLCEIYSLKFMTATLFFYTEFVMGDYLLPDYFCLWIINQLVTMVYVRSLR